MDARDREKWKAMPSKHAYVGPTSANVGIGAATSPSGDDVGPTLYRRRLATSQDDANPTSVVGK